MAATTYYLRDTTTESCAAGTGAPDTWDMGSSGGTQYNTYGDCPDVKALPWVTYSKKILLKCFGLQ